MVKICNTTRYQMDADLSEDCKQVIASSIASYPFDLSPFQQYAIEAIVTGHHILITAHTGSGKTLPAEFAIQHFAERQQEKRQREERQWKEQQREKEKERKKTRVIYTAPIKALSNQKMYEFSRAFPDISFGILTGDIKTNPDADVLIMTTEILMNTLYQCNGQQKTSTNALFSMDDVACVIFDEVHYINDRDRGHVWEETLMLLDPSIQLVMLSATMDSPLRFAEWIEDHQYQVNIKRKPDNQDNQTRQTNQGNKWVYMATTNQRIVPLSHYAYVCGAESVIKKMKNGLPKEELIQQTNVLHLLQQSSSPVFQTATYTMVNRLVDQHQLFVHQSGQKGHVKRPHVLNSIGRYMVQHNMLPAICFVLSRKALEQCAREVTTVLLEDDSKVPYTVRRECEQVLRKLPNYREYLELKEYVDLVALLEKGIAIHHAGMMPVLREMVELLFSKGYVKWLFATETFAVGINMPTKTVLFTDMMKYDGSTSRLLHAHEYSQMSGRAGRRGIDPVGHVIHLVNLFSQVVSPVEMQQVMKGTPQPLESAFSVTPALVLNLIQGWANQGSNQMEDQVKETETKSWFTYALQYIDQSMYGLSIRRQIEQMEKDQEDKKTQMQLLLDEYGVSYGRQIPLEVAQDYQACKRALPTLTNQKRRAMQKQIDEYEGLYSALSLEQAGVAADRYDHVSHQLDAVVYKCAHIGNTIRDELGCICEELMTEGFIFESSNESSTDDANLTEEEDESNDFNHPILTEKGHCATLIREVDGLFFSRLLVSHGLSNWDPIELVGLFSCFTSVTVPADRQAIRVEAATTSANVRGVLEWWISDHEYKQDQNQDRDPMTYDLIPYAMQWCDGQTEMECKVVLATLKEDKQVSIGEFIKAMLKINTIAKEMETVAERLGDLALLSRLKAIPELTLKFVATNQSLYV